MPWLHKPIQKTHIRIIYKWIIFIDVASTTEDYAYYGLTVCINYLGKGIAPMYVCILTPYAYFDLAFAWRFLCRSISSCSSN